MGIVVDETDLSRTTDRLGNPLGEGVPYARGKLLQTSEDDYKKLSHAWEVIAARSEALGRDAIYNLSGLERSLPPEPSSEHAAIGWQMADDDLSPAFNLEALVAAGLDHLGGENGTHDIAVFNRLTAATYATVMTLVRPGDVVVGVSASYSHPSVVRAVGHVGARLLDTSGVRDFAVAMESDQPISLVVLTRLAVTYDLLDIADIQRVMEIAHAKGVPVYIDDAGGARVGPAIFSQPRLLQLGADVGATGLDKYGTVGPRVGLLGGRRDLVSRIRARAFEMGMEARPMLYSRVRHSLEQYRPERVRDLVDTTLAVGRAMKAHFGERVRMNDIIADLAAEDIYELALERSGLASSTLVPYEATAALAMVLLRDYGVMTVHFAGVPPGTSSILFKFVPPETLERFGGAEAFATAVDTAVDSVAGMIGDPSQVAALLFGDASESAGR